MANGFVRGLLLVVPGLGVAGFGICSLCGGVMGVVVDLTAVERQALARYTQDAGNHVSLSVRPAAVLSVR